MIDWIKLPDVADLISQNNDQLIYLQTILMNISHIDIVDLLVKLNLFVAIHWLYSYCQDDVNYFFFAKHWCES